MTTDYCTASDLKGAISIGDSDDDPVIATAISSASRMIDGWCNRRFYLDASATARTYLTPYKFAPAVVDLRGKVWHDFDPATVPVIKTDDDGDGTFETTWTVGTDYQLEPLNHAEVEAEPQNQIRLLGPRMIGISVWGRPQLQVTAKWGWPSVPVAVKQACQLVAKDIFTSKDAVGNVGGQTATGVFTIDDNPYVKRLLSQYRLPSGIG